MKYIASVSFGKDSLAMLLMLIEKKYPLDEVVFYDTGMEFKAIYNLKSKIELLLKEHNIKFTELKPEYDFLYKMFKKPVKERKTGNIHYGYSWCGGTCRWGTSDKLRYIEKYCKGNYEYVGIAADETMRIEKERKGNKLFPLVEWKITEQQALDFCYAKGYDWNEDDIDLYKILKRVSCWCCGNKNLKELKNYYKFLPDYWDKLKKLQLQTSRNMKGKYSVLDLEKKFDKELEVQVNE